jgi:hypothetical protein
MPLAGVLEQALHRWFIFPSQPVISGIAPASGASQTLVTITGTGFGAAQGNSFVTFNGRQAPVVSWSATFIVVLVPNGATLGPVFVFVTVGSVISAGFAFTVLLDNNQKLMVRIIWDCHRRGVHVTEQTLISTVCLWAVGHGFSYQWIEANDVNTVTNDWLALKVYQATIRPQIFPPAVVIVSDIDIP